MKLAKLVTIIGLTTGIALGAFVDLAEARGRGGRGSGSRFDDFNVEYKFELFTKTVDGIKRTPNDAGTFENAIEDFKGRFFDFDDNFLLDNFDSVVNKDNIINITNEFVQKGDAPVEQPTALTLDLTPEFYSTADRLEYILTSDELDTFGITELVLIIEDFSNKFPPLDIEDFSNEFLPLDSDKAKSSIDYIVDNKLLGLVNGIRVSGPSRINPEVIFSSESFITVSGINFTPIQSTPESSNLLGLFILGGLGTSVLLKQKINQA